VLDGLLVRAAGDAGAVVHDRTPVTDLLRRGNRVVGVLATTPDGRSVDIDAALVVGADGIASTVARRAGATPSRVGAHASVTTYGYWSDLPTDGYEWNYRPDACSGAFPTDHGQVCVRISTSSTRIGSSGVALIRHVVAEGAPELSERLDRASPPGRTQTWPGRRGYVRRSHGPGWALVGDAAWFTDPIGAHGTTAALRDAELLARAVVEGLGHDATLTQALARYEATRDRLGIPVFDVVDRIAGHEWDEAEIADRLLQLSSATAAEVEALAALEPGRAA
jgi:2-polyprenyl-6-methoxyphenol hydroxylase-like FAD-dependent oxidoreductase